MTLRLFHCSMIFSSLSILVFPPLRYISHVSIFIFSLLFIISVDQREKLQVTDKDGEKRWKRVEVRLKDHVHVPVFASGMSTQFYDECLDHYLSKTAMEEFPQSQPLWEVHIIKYPTSHAASNIVFKFHHSLGDGISLMGALLSCLKRTDNPSLSLTFPSAKMHTSKDGGNFSMFRKVPRFLYRFTKRYQKFVQRLQRVIWLRMTRHQYDPRILEWSFFLSP